jgi:hypothetical protein
MSFHPSVIHRVDKQVARIRSFGSGFDSRVGSSLASSQSSGTGLNVRQIFVNPHVINVPFSAISELSDSLNVDEFEADSAYFGLSEGLLKGP